jgi:hypothetical protein
MYSLILPQHINSSTTHEPTRFCLIPRNAYIVGEKLNPSNAYIMERRE